MGGGKRNVDPGFFLKLFCKIVFPAKVKGIQVFFLNFFCDIVFPCQGEGDQIALGHQGEASCHGHRRDGIFQGTQPQQHRDQFGDPVGNGHS